MIFIKDFILYYNILNVFNVFYFNCRYILQFVNRILRVTFEKKFKTI